MKLCRIIFSGAGGQGLITAGRVLAEAAIIHEGLNAIQSQSYGSTVRGGLSRSDVIISDEDIIFPKVIQPNVIVCLTQKTYNKYCHLIRPGGLLLTDCSFVKQKKMVDARQVELDMYRAVVDKIGKPIVFNMCVLGALCSLTELIKHESIMKVLESCISPEYLTLNKEALILGTSLADAFKKNRGIQNITLW